MTLTANSRHFMTSSMHLFTNVLIHRGFVKCSAYTYRQWRLIQYLHSHLFQNTASLFVLLIKDVQPKTFRVKEQSVLATSLLDDLGNGTSVLQLLQLQI